MVGHKDKAIHMAQLKTEHLSGLEFVKCYINSIEIMFDTIV